LPRQHDWKSACGKAAAEKKLHPRFADAVSGEIIVPQHVTK